MEKVTQGLMCIACHGNSLSFTKDFVVCQTCSRVFPIVNGIPIMIDETRSIFKFADFVNQRNLFFDIDPSGHRNARLGRIFPSLESHHNTSRNYKHLQSRLVYEFGTPRVLILGGSIAGIGMSPILDDEHVELIESDVSYGPRTQIILDAHQIPYVSGSFDCVIVQAVLEHVVDPYACVNEIHRVLRPTGLVYAETPFMQQVHGRQFDFTRFTHSGHRRLFRCFEEITSGMTSGPGSAAAWSYQYLLLSLLGYSEKSVLYLKAFARLTGFWLKYLDVIAAGNPRSIDAACGLYFLGRRSGTCLGDDEIVNYYWQNRQHPKESLFGVKP